MLLTAKDAFERVIVLRIDPQARHALDSPMLPRADLRATRPQRARPGMPLPCKAPPPDPSHHESKEPEHGARSIGARRPEVAASAVCVAEWHFEQEEAEGTERTAIIRTSNPPTLHAPRS